ncbi:MAG: cyclophilin-like fold protein [Candidatus Nezhaarchaeales archaeon]
MSKGSFSRLGVLEGIKVLFEFEGYGVVKGEIVRVLAPRTVEALYAALPIRSRVYRWREGVYFETSVVRGLEKPRVEVNPGDICYYARSKAVCLFHDKAKPLGGITLLGRVVENLELLPRVKSGSFVLMRVNSTF